jgi:hypothetical protein
MEPYSKCYLCQDYNPSPLSKSGEKGFCLRLDDTTFSFPAYTHPSFKCPISLPKITLSPQEASERWIECEKEYKTLLNSIEKALKFN